MGDSKKIRKKSNHRCCMLSMPCVFVSCNLQCTLERQRVLSPVQLSKGGHRHFMAGVEEIGCALKCAWLLDFVSPCCPADRASSSLHQIAEFHSAPMWKTPEKEGHLEAST